MIHYEIKKIFSSVGSKIALLLLGITVLLGCWSAVNGRGTEWVNEQGDNEAGYAAAQRVRIAKKEWAGLLDTERLTEALLENHRIEATPEAQSRDYAQNDIAYGWKQGFSDIRDVINNFLAVDFNTSDYYLADSLSVSALPELYDHRVQNLKDFLYREDSYAYSRFSDGEKAWLVQQYENLETPMMYDYFSGWRLVAEYSDTITMLFSMILGYLVAGIFANEFKWRSDAIYYSTALGKTRNTKAKIQAGFLLVTAAYWTGVLVYSLFTLCYLGFDGWNCPVQLERWKCFYNITFLERYLMVILGGYLGNLFSAFLTMWISAKTKSAVIAVTVPFLLIFLPNFFQNYEGSFLGKVLGLLPDRLLQINNAINYFDLYSVGSLVVGAIPVLFAMYLLLTSGLIPAIYWEFSRKELI